MEEPKPSEESSSTDPRVVILRISNLPIWLYISIGVFFLVVLVLLGLQIAKYTTIPRTPITYEKSISNNPGEMGTQYDAQAGRKVVVNFTYTVKNISPSDITLTGQNGDFVLPNDPKTVTVYAGATSQSPVLPLSRLKIGDSLNLEFVLGKSASLFIVEK